MLVIVAHGKMRSLGNNSNNVTRQDEPSACLSGGHSLWCGVQRGEERKQAFCW